MPTERKGGTFAKSDIPLIRKALNMLLSVDRMNASTFEALGEATNEDFPERTEKILKLIEENQREISNIGNLLHRLER